MSITREPHPNDVIEVLEITLKKCYGVTPSQIDVITEVPLVALGNASAREYLSCNTSKDDLNDVTVVLELVFDLRLSEEI